MIRCLSCGRTKEDPPYYGSARCTPGYCQEQGINPGSEKHVLERKRLLHEAEQWPKPEGWRLNVFYNVGWRASLRGPDGASVSPIGDGLFGAFGRLSGQGPSVGAALRDAARSGHRQAVKVAAASKVYADAAASI